MVMPFSPAGRGICDLSGDAATIRRHGNEITSLGNQMIDGADFLASLAEQTTEQRGKAVEKLREIVGDTHVELRRAGRMYQPTGPVLVSYATSLAEAQPRVNAAVTECRTLWSAYDGAPGLMPGERGPVPDDQEGTPEAEEQADQDAAKQDKYEAFIAQARIFDSEIDTWEDAFDTAVSGIGDILDGSIEDGFWDDVDGFVAGTLQVLQVIGIIVAIAGIIIGGPIIALIAGIVGVLTLALTIYQFCRSDTGMTELILAIVGVIPFGSMGKLFQGGAGRLAFLGDTFMAFKPSSWTAAISQGQNLTMISRFAGGGFSGLLAGGREFLTMNNPAGVGDVMTRLMFGKDVKGLTGMIDAMSGGANGFCNSTTIAAGWEFAYTVISGSWKLGDKIATWTGNGGKGPSGSVPWVGAVL